MKLLQLLLLLIPLALLSPQVSAQGSSSSSQRPSPSPSPSPDPPITRTTITVSPSPSPTVAPPTTSDPVTTSSRSNPVVTSTSFTIVDPTQSPSAASSPTPRPVTPGAPAQNNSNSASSLLQNTAFLVGIGIASGVVLLCAVVLAFVRARNKSSDNESLSGLPWVHRPNASSSYGSHRPSNASSTLKSEMSLPQNYYSPKPLPASPRVIYPSTYQASPQTQPQQPSSPIDYNNYSYLPPSSSPYQQQPQQYPAQMQESIQYDPDIRPAMRYPTQSSASSSPRSNGFPAQSQTQNQSPLVLSQNPASDQFQQQNPVYDINYEQEAFNYDSPHTNPIPVPPTHSPRTQSHTVQHSSSQSNLNRFRLPSPPPVMLEAPSTHVLSSDGSAYMNGNGNGNGNHPMDQGLVNAPTAFARPLPPPPNM